MSNDTFDYDSYHKNISLLLEMARDEYKRHFIELPSIQDRTIKTYLWISGALLGLQITTFDKLTILPFTSKVWFTLSVILSFISFCWGIDSLRSREPSVFGIKSYNKLLNDTHGWANKQGSDRKLKISLLNFLETAIDAERRINAWRATRQRAMSYILLFSSGSTGMIIISYFFD